MTGLDARTYHQRTTHTPASVRAGGRGLDWDNRPRPYKRYRGVEPCWLPGDWPQPERPAAEVLSDQRADAGSLDLAGLARLLFLATGVSRHARTPIGPMWFRTAPSAGALYPVEAYVAVGETVDGLGPGLYHYEPVQHVLQPLRDVDVRGNLANAAARPDLAGSPVWLCLTGIPWRTTWKYGLRGWRHLFWDAGCVLANALVAADSAGLDADVCSGFVDTDVDAVLGLDAQRTDFAERSLALAALGTPAPGPAPAPVALAPLHLDVDPLSHVVREEPGLLDAHDGGRLHDPRDVAGWREALHGAEAAAPRTASPAPPALGPERVDDLILRRGSTRSFAPSGAAREADCRWALAVADQAVPGDLAPAGRTWLTAFLTCHLVEGLEPGAYRHEAGALALLRAEQPRRTAAHLCLDQPLGGTSAFTAFLTADVATLVAAAGSRAYRVAQLEAGVAAGRLQLAAFAAGLGGTGLTFYDAEVRRFFDTDREPMLVTAVGRPAYRPRSGRLPRDLPDVVLEG